MSSWFCHTRFNWVIGDADGEVIIDVMPQSWGSYDGVLRVVYSILTFQNGEVFIGMGHDRGALIHVDKCKRRQIAVQRSKDSPLNRSG